MFGTGITEQKELGGQRDKEMSRCHMMGLCTKVHRGVWIFLATRQRNVALTYDGLSTKRQSNVSLRGGMNFLATRQRNVALTYDGALYLSPHDKEKFHWGGYALFWQRDKEMSRWHMMALCTKVYETRQCFSEGGGVWFFLAMWQMLRWHMWPLD